MFGTNFGNNASSGGVSYTPEAIAYFDAVEDAGGTLTDNVKDEYNAFVIREKDASRYDKIKRLYPYLGGAINSARIDAVSLASATNVNFVDADADATCGLQPDGSTKYLVDSNANAIWASVNDAQGWHFQNGTSGGTSYMFGAQKTTATVGFIGLLQTVSNTIAAVGDLAIVANGASMVGAKSAAFGRFSSTDLRVWVDGASQVQNTTANSEVLPALPVYIFARNRNNSASLLNSVLSYGTMMAEGMTTTELLASEASYRTFLTNIEAI